ncbi:MAG TPA: HK97 family phage prohead protease [Candidatus Acidoferrum sp.]|nr:HK97 family phage prohead protease [Candidatus Acidoferrum sp.]
MERTAFEVRKAHVAGDGNKEKKIVGLAAAYNAMSRPIPANGGGEFREVLLPGAFDAVLRTSPDVVCLLNHNQNFVLGRTSSGTLKLHADSRGLAFECLLPNTTYGADTYEAVRRGDLKGCSFAFSDAEAEWSSESDPNGRSGRGLDTVVVRTISKVKTLYDISVVTTPAYDATQVSARSISPEVRSKFFGGRSIARWRQHPSWRSLCAGLDIDPDTESPDVAEIMNRMQLEQAPELARRRLNLLNEILGL